MRRIDKPLPTGRPPPEAPTTPLVLGPSTSSRDDSLNGVPRGPPHPPFKARPLVVRPSVARRLLGNIGSMKLWELINSGELDSYLDGRRRFITVESIERRVARKLAEARDENGRIKLYEHGVERAEAGAG